MFIYTFSCTSELSRPGGAKCASHPESPLKYKNKSSHSTVCIRFRQMCWLILDTIFSCVNSIRKPSPVGTNTCSDFIFIQQFYQQNWSKKLSNICKTSLFGSFHTISLVESTYLVGNVDNLLSLLFCRVWLDTYSKNKFPKRLSLLF